MFGGIVLHVTPASFVQFEPTDSLLFPGGDTLDATKSTQKSMGNKLGLTQGKVMGQMSHKQLTEDMLLC